MRIGYKYRLPVNTTTKLVCIVVVMFAGVCPAIGQDTKADQAVLKEALVKLEKQSWEAWKNRDGRFFENFLSDDHVELGFSGPANKSSVVAFVGSPLCSVRNYEVDHFQLAVFDANTALLTYHAAQDTTCGGKPVPSPVWVSSLYLKRDGRWLNVLYQQTAEGK